MKQGGNGVETGLKQPITFLLPHALDERVEFEFVFSGEFHFFDRDLNGVKMA